MQVQLELPDEIAQALNIGDLSRAAIEALALEGYRSRRLGRGQVQRLVRDDPEGHLTARAAGAERGDRLAGISSRERRLSGLHAGNCRKRYGYDEPT